jgi:predicted RNA-binding protein Jag
MTEEAVPAAAASAPAPVTPADPARRERAVEVLSELFKLMDLPARLEAKDAADGGISIALHPEGQFPGLPAPGSAPQPRRSHVVDAVQFIANKLVNKAGMEKRWISIGVGGHPEPRTERPPKGPPTSAPRGEAPRPRQASPNDVTAPVAAPRPPAPPRAPRPVVDEEANVQAPEEPALNVLAQLLAQKAAGLGRFYAVAPMKLEDRARMLKAAQGVPGVKVFAEGEGRNRRLVFAPDNPVPIKKPSVLPQDDDG